MAEVDGPIQWEQSFGEALERSKTEKKPVMVFFHRDNCSGCAKLEALTYPDPTVAATIKEHFVPVKVNIREDIKLTQQYQAFWTPGIGILAGDGTLVYRNEGWLPPPEFAVTLLLARGYYFYRTKRQSQAAFAFNDLVTTYPTSPFAPEAQYMLGVCAYLDGSPEEQDEAFRLLIQWYPDSLWTAKARGI